jgi:hypothetical protein
MRTPILVSRLSAICLLFLTAPATNGDEPLPNSAPKSSSKITAPLPFQVIQRDGYDPLHAHVHAIGGPKRGHAEVPVTADFPGLPDGATAEYRIVPLKDAFGQGTDWAKIDAPIHAGKLAAKVHVPAGGWYRLELRTTSATGQSTTATMEPFGVGEVFLIAGQSYAAGANEEHQKVADPQGRVVLYDWAKNEWRVAHDPFPNMGDGGTIWPPFGNSLLPLAQVPIGLINVAVGATASSQWLPGGDYYARLSKAAKTAGRFRAVLWQQGESDVIAKTSTAVYVANLTAMHAALDKDAGFSPPWLLAKSTLHPTVYNRPAEEQAIRDAIDQLLRQPGFLPGPDTDILGAENRGPRGTRRHFTALGQQRAGLMWFASVWNLLSRPADNTEP